MKVVLSEHILRVGKFGLLALDSTLVAENSFATGTDTDPVCDDNEVSPTKNWLDASFLTALRSLSLLLFLSLPFRF